MKPEEQNIAIAKILGYEFISGEHPFLTGLPRYWQGAESRRPILNYTECLNAMHEAECMLECAELYEEWLISICKNTPIWNATAAQRAEAFLRTLGKWEETE